MIKKLLLVSLLLVPLVHVRHVSAQITPSQATVKSIDVVYEIGMDSLISTTETITLENGGTGAYVRRIPKKVSGIRYQESSTQDDSSVGYSVNNVTAFVGESQNLIHRISEDNNEVRVTVKEEDLDSENRKITIRYQINRAIMGVNKKDDLNVRNNIELLGNLIVLGENPDENTVMSVTATVKSPYAIIGSLECFAGDLNNGQRMCLSEYDKNSGRTYSTGFLGKGKGLMFSFKMMKGGDVDPPGKGEIIFGKLWESIRVNWKTITSVVLIIYLSQWLLGKMIYIKFKK